jgi:hypothetical protein
MTNTYYEDLANVSFYVADIKAATTWHSDLLGIEPYFERPDSNHPVYIESRIGDYQHELGIVDSRYAPKNAVVGPGVRLYTGMSMMWQQPSKR